MSTSEELHLQLLHKAGEESEVSSHTRGQKLLNQPAKGAMNHTVMSQWNKISLSVVTLLGYTSVYAAMSTVTAYYAIVVSWSLKVLMEKFWAAIIPLESCYHAKQHPC